MKLFQTHNKHQISLIFASFTVIFLILDFAGCSKIQDEKTIISSVTTIAGFSDDKAKHFGEPFGVSIDKTGILYVSDGEQGKIWRVLDNEKLEIVTDKLNTPSAMAFDKDRQ